ncbi:MAG: CotH kinase family protein [Planctomycetota bacterium]|nr:CotH kinase family protein [Planctomycetota bacterium]
MFLAPVFMKDGDQNGEGKLSREEFAALGRKWFAVWDKSNAGRVTNDQLRSGLNVTFAPPPGFAPRGPGAPGFGHAPGVSMFQGRNGQRNGLASTMGIDFQFVHADLEIQGQLVTDVAVRYKGNGTWVQSQGSMKRSLKVHLKRFTKSQNLAGISEFNLHSCVTDAGFMNEVLSYRLFRDVGVPAGRTTYARVYVTVPGQYERKYLGLYSIVENVDAAFIHERFKGKKGAIFKPVTPSLFSDLGDDWAKYRQAYDPKTDVSESQARRVIEFAGLVTKADDAEFAAEAGEYLDLDEFSRFMAVTVWLSTLDSILTTGQNYYLYLDPQTNKFQFLPWDLDHSFGQFYVMGSQEQRENLSIHQPWQGNNRFLERVFKLEAFKKLYLARLQEFGTTIFKAERFHQQVDEIAAAIRPAVEEESKEKLARFDKVVAGQAVPPAGFGGPANDPPAGGGGDVRFGGPSPFMMPSPKPIKGFVTARAQSVLDQLSGRKQGHVMAGFGFGPGGGPNPPGGPGAPGGPPAAFGPGMFLTPVFMAAHDTNKDGQLARDEFIESFVKWFDAWNSDKSGTLTDQQLRAGIDKALMPPMPTGFGPPGAPAPRP